MLYDPVENIHDPFKILSTVLKKWKNSAIENLRNSTWPQPDSPTLNAPSCMADWQEKPFECQLLSKAVC